jgi:hypothetical protein
VGGVGGKVQNGGCERKARHIGIAGPWMAASPQGSGQRVATPRKSLFFEKIELTHDDNYSGRSQEAV